MTAVQPLATSAGRAAELGRLLDFAQRSAVPGAPGFAYLDARGEADPAQAHPLWITSRMTHVFGLAHLLGRPGAGDLVRSGVGAMAEAFNDAEHGGWYGRLDTAGAPADERKAMYDHAFVVLASSTARLAGVPGAEPLLAQALDVVDQHFWDEDAGLCRESWDRAWTHAEDYRGANSAMHGVEAFLAAGAVTGDTRWTQRALSIAERIVHRVAAERNWRLPEHFDAQWRVRTEYNAGSPADQFRPYGVTVGHLLEWARLLLHLESALSEPPQWLLHDATALFATAVQVGWEADGLPGFVYTVDWEDAPVVVERMHWVAIEAAMTGEVVAHRTGRDEHVAWAQRLWRAVEPFVDREHGGWHHELDPLGHVSSTVWEGKPDAYHAVQGMLLPDLRLTPSVATSVAAGPSSRTRNQ